MLVIDAWLCDMQIQVEGNLPNELHFRGQTGLEEKHEFWRRISFWKGAFRRS